MIESINNTLAIAQEYLPDLSALQADYHSIDKDAIEKQALANSTANSKSGKVAILPLQGVITQKNNWWGTSTETFGKWLDVAVNDSSISRIVIDVNSPGGSVYGVKELADKIYAARSKKPIVAVVNSLMASAAYWIGSAAGQIYTTPSGETGSIGVIMVHSDYSKYFEAEGVNNTIIKAGEFKGEGNYYEPLSDESLKFLQKGVDDYYDMFIISVAKHRGKSKETIKADFGKGRCFVAKDALKVGMVDGIKTLDDVLKMRAMATQSKRLAQAQLELIKCKG